MNKAVMVCLVCVAALLDHLATTPFPSHQYNFSTLSKTIQNVPFQFIRATQPDSRGVLACSLQNDSNAEERIQELSLAWTSNPTRHNKEIEDPAQKGVTPQLQPKRIYLSRAPPSS